MWEGGRRKAECFEGSGSQTRGSMVQIPSPPVTFYPRTSAGKIKHKCQSLLSCFQVPGKMWCFIYRQCFLRQISQLLEDKQRKERSVLSCLSCSFNWNQELLRESLCVQGKKYIKKQHPRGKTFHLYCIHKKTFCPAVFIWNHAHLHYFGFLLSICFMLACLLFMDQRKVYERPLFILMCALTALYAIYT